MSVTVLRDRAFRGFLASDILSGFGVGLSTIGANWYVLMQTGESRHVGGLLVVNVVAGFLSSLVSGVLTDRFARRNVILAMHLARLAMALMIGGALLLFGFQLYLLYVFAGLNGAGWTIYMAASRSLAQELTPKDEYVSANSLLEVSLQVGMFVAGAASGFVYKYAGFAEIMLVTAAMYGVGAGAIKLVRATAVAVPADRPSYVTMLSQGFRFLRSHPATFVIGAVSIVPLVVTMLFNVVLPGYVSHDLGGDSVVFGFGDMSYGVGGLIAGLTVAWIAARLSPKRLVLAFFGLSAAVLGLLGWNSLVVGLYIGCVGLGLTNSAIRILMNSLIMERVPEEYMGRAMTVWLGVSLGLQCLFSIFFSSYLDRAGAGVGFALMAALMVVGLIGFIVVNRVDSRNAQTAG